MKKHFSLPSLKPRTRQLTTERADSEPRLEAPTITLVDVFHERSL